jgi:DNA ligase-associated metallophosphoesterase
MIHTRAAGEALWLLPERAVYWPAQRTLLLADPHFGKAAAFRAGGIPVPAGTTADNLARLDSALAATGATQLVCLGDLLHARAGRVARTVEAVAVWRARHEQLQWLLVRGNHDRHAGDPPPAWRITCLDEPVVDAPFVWRHEPREAEEGYVLAGHVHPAVRLGRGALAETLPCFVFGRRVGILPAFGDFTGQATLRPQPEDRLFVLAGDEVIAVGRDQG